MNILDLLCEWFPRPIVTKMPPPGPTFIILRTSTKHNEPINQDEAVQFGEGIDAINQLLEWCKEQKFRVIIHANGFDNGGESIDSPCLEICDDYLD